MICIIMIMVMRILRYRSKMLYISIILYFKISRNICWSIMKKHVNMSMDSLVQWFFSNFIFRIKWVDIDTHITVWQFPQGVLDLHILLCTALKSRFTGQTSYTSSDLRNAVRLEIVSGELEDWNWSQFGVIRAVTLIHVTSQLNEQKTIRDLNITPNTVTIKHINMYHSCVTKSSW